MFLTSLLGLIFFVFLFYQRVILMLEEEKNNNGRVTTLWIKYWIDLPRWNNSSWIRCIVLVQAVETRREQPQRTVIQPMLLTVKIQRRSRSIPSS